MLSREADALFWMGRYLERAEATARIVDVQYHAALESPLPSRTRRPCGARSWRSATTT
jgi:uncharacterized alpha-E superfamily protein